VTSDPVDIRPSRPDDLDDVYRVCLLTADNGEDATSLFRDPRMPGHVWAGPYVTFERSLAFVAEDGAGIGGYILGALDSKAFERRLERDWWPPLRVAYPEPPPDQMEKLAQIERYALLDMHRPFGAPDKVISRFPSHMHIDLLPRMQGRGVGRRLVSTLISSLIDQDSPGLHLQVGFDNPRAVGFYRHIGFSEHPHSGHHIFTMNLAK